MKACGRILLLTLISLILCISVSFAKQGDPEYKEGELIVKFKSGVGIKAAADTHAHVRSEVVKHHRITGVQLVKLKTGLTTMEAIELYRSDPNILYAEPNYILHALDVFPNDPNFNNLWGLHNIAQTGGNTDADIDAPEAWQITTGSRDVIVAVIDTGVDYNHEDLAINMWKNIAELNGIPGVDDDGNGYIDDIYGIDTFNNDSNPMDDHDHGTHVSGTIGAVGNNGIGVAGINWNVKIMALKFISSNGYGYTSDAIECLEYAIMMKQNYGQNIRITSNSWGGRNYSKALRDAIQEAGNADILFVAAAGNDGSDNDTERFYPSSYDPANIISVAATDHNDKLASFSNWGLAAVDVAAPGVNILSSTLNNGYEYFSGTSMAAPHVAGLAALILAKHPEYSYTQVKEYIFTSADPIAVLDGRVFTGSRINAANALTNTLTCDPSRLRFIVLSPSTQFGALKDSQNIIRVFVATCRGPINNATVTVNFGNGDPGLTLHDDGIYPDLVAGDGLYSGLWVPEVLGEITLNVNASVPGYGTVSNNISGAVADLTANFSAEPTSGQSSLTVHFTDLSTGNPGIQSWHWNFGDGGTSAERNPTHTYYRSGNFTVSLTITYETLQITKTIAGYIKVSESPPPEINSITPVDGWMATQMPVTITGSNFQKTPNAALYGGGPYTIGSINLCSSDFYISGNYAYVACSGTLQIIDIADPTNPKNIIYFSLPGDNYGIYVSGNYAYVVKGSTGFQVIDVRNPANPVIVGSVDTPGYAMAFQISGNYAYVADYSTGLQVIDITDPAKPIIAGSIDTPGNARSVSVSGNYAYVADEGAVQVIDVTNPAKPVIAGSCYIPDYAYNIYVSGNYAYVKVVNNGYLRIVDISNPSRPRIVGNLDMPGNATDINISGNVAYVTIMYDYGRGLLEILDITDLTKPLIVGYHSMPQSALRVHIHENHAYVASRVGTATLLEILDVTHLTNPTMIASRNMSGTANGIYIFDKFAYITTGNENGKGSLYIMDISDPFNPVKTGSCNTPGYANSVHVSGNYAYVADGYAGLRVIDITNPANPIIIGYVDTPGNALAVHVSGNYVYVADGNAGLQVIDVTNPSNPIIAGSRAPLGYGFYGVYISGNYAYVTDWNAGLLIIDITSPAHPTIVGSCKALSATGGVYVSGNYAYVADYFVRPGLTVVDVTDPLNPFIVGAWGDEYLGVYYSCYDVHVQGNYAYVACIDSIYVIDISDLYNPVLLGSSQTPGKAQGLHVQGDYVYVADGDLGLMILKTLVPFSDEVWFGSDKIMAAAPAGLLPGVYNLHVSNMDGLKAVLHNAFTVKKGVAHISISPAIFNFDNVTVGGSSLSQTFLVSNTGETDIVIDSSSITGQDIYDFNMQKDNCLNKTLAPSSTCTVQVIFSPASEGLKNANLSVPYTLFPPSVPIGLTATVESSSRIDLLWTDNSNNEVGFKIERKEGAGGIYSQIATVGPNVAAYSDMGLMPGTIYYYRIRTYNEGGDSNYSNEANATTLPLLPSPPSGLTATTVSSSRINLIWTDNSNNETGFTIERKEGAGGIYSQIVTVGPNVAAYSDMGLMPGTIYYYRIRTYNEAGDSSYSNEAHASTLPLPPSPPTGLTTTAVSPIQINLSWTDNSNNEAGFTIERKEGSGGAYFHIATVGPNITVYSDRGLTPNTTYYYSVRAYNENGDSSSSEASATTFPPSQNITLNITYPLTGDTIFRPDVLVIGDIINTTGNETGVTVDGIVATVYGNQFIANHVPLEEGLNSIIAIATDTAGDTASTSITVNAITTGDYIRMTSNIESGIIPLEVTMKIDGSFAIPDSTISVTGPAQPEFIESAADGYEVRMTVEGIYYFTASVTGPDSNVYQDTIAIIVLNQIELDNLLREKWERMRTALVNKDITVALNYYSEETKQLHNDIFTGLYDYLPQIAQEMHGIQMIYAKNNTAQYRMRQDEVYGGQIVTMTYYIYFVVDRDGTWKIYRY